MKHYEFVGINLPKELVKQIDTIVKDPNTPYAHRTAFIHYVLYQYINREKK